MSADELKSFALQFAAMENAYAKAQGVPVETHIDALYLAAEKAGLFANDRTMVDALISVLEEFYGEAFAFKKHGSADIANLEADIERLQRDVEALKAFYEASPTEDSKKHGPIFLKTFLHKRNQHQA